VFVAPPSSEQEGMRGLGDGRPVRQPPDLFARRGFDPRAM
jgi:hypothetical protein